MIFFVITLEICSKINYNTIKDYARKKGHTKLMEKTMVLQDWLKLKNGTDVRGVALEGIEGEHVNLTDDVLTTIAKAFTVWLAQRTGKKNPVIAVGHDSRLSAKRVETCVANGVTEMGSDVILTGLSSTPSMFMLLQKEDFGADGSIEITASHLPFNKNGLKFFVKEGGLEGSDITEILTICANGAFVLQNEKGSIRERSFMDDYSADLVQMVRSATGEEEPLKGSKILVDAGNGAGGFYVDKVLKPLGADTTGSQFLEPDGSFPNHIPNPENEQAMQSVCKAVIENQADFGIIFDTDVDRAGAVDADGEEINRNKLIALISAILLEENPGSTIVTDSVTSDGLAEFIAAKGGVHCRFKRGYKNVINESKRLNAEGKYSPLAIETSGHAALKENYFLDDGAYLVTRILISLAKQAKEGKKLTDMIKDLKTPLEAAEIRPTFQKDVDFKALGAGVLKDFDAYVDTLPYCSKAPDNFEGLRVNFDKDHGDGWVLVRMSLHEPIMPINAESDSKGGVKKLIREIYDFLKQYEFLNLEKFKAYLD